MVWNTYCSVQPRFQVNSSLVQFGAGFQQNVPPSEITVFKQNKKLYENELLKVIKPRKKLANNFIWKQE